MALGDELVRLRGATLNVCLQWLVGPDRSQVSLSFHQAQRVGLSCSLPQTSVENWFKPFFFFFMHLCQNGMGPLFLLFWLTHAQSTCIPFYVQYKDRSVNQGTPNLYHLWCMTWVPTAWSQWRNEKQVSILCNRLALYDHCVLRDVQVLKHAFRIERACTQVQELYIYSTTCFDRKPHHCDYK